VTRVGAALALLCLAAGAALAADGVRRVEAVGAVGLDPATGWTTPPRDAALRRALAQAVTRVAEAQLPDLDPESAEDALRPALGDDPFAYATRFRILEDRGERPALLVQEAGVEREYVVVVEAYVDADKVRESLARAGLLDAPSGDGLRSRFQVTVLGLDSYATYAAVREALVGGAGADSATPVEVSRGRAVFDVVASRAPSALLDALLAQTDPTLEFIPVDEDDRALVVRVEHRPAAGEPAAEAPSGFDTPGRKRY
jgi:hypothetical protein